MKPLIVIVGPTATGKSSLAIELAERFNGEIISADSWLVRKGVDIGTAKPTRYELSMVKHHLINIINANEDFSAAVYKKQAKHAIEDIASKDKVPFLVGGTGLYVDAVLYDYSFLPSASQQLRQELNAKTLIELHDLALRKGLPLDSIDVRNKRRVIRLIETNGAVAVKSDIRPNSLIIGLNSSKDELENNIKLRIEKMFKCGLEKEVSSLVDQYGWQCEALKGIGYHEWKLYFEGKQSLSDTKQRIIKDTMLLAKRQTTWFKLNKSIRWFNTPVKYTDIEELVTTYLNKNYY
jgi:tRNA dimethylallyltransferase